MRHKRFKRKNRRAGIAATEVALTLPLLLLLTSATLDICDGLFLRQKLVLAAQEGARIAVGPEDSIVQIHRAVDDYMVERGLQFNNINDVVSVTPGHQELTPMSPVAVSVTVSASENRRARLPFSIVGLFQNDDVTVEVTMLKER